MRRILKAWTRLKAALSEFVRILKNDPVRGCDVFKEEGCAHVDGFLCDYPDCEILRDYRACKARVAALRANPDGPQPCCDKENRSMSGGCLNCGDPSF